MCFTRFVARSWFGCLIYGFDCAFLKVLCQCGVYGAQPQGFRNLKGLGSCGPRHDARCIAHSEILVSAAQVGGLTRGLGT